MTGVRMEMTYDDAQVQAMLARIGALDGDSLHPALDAIGAAMEARTVLRFEEGRGPGGIPWVPSKRVQRSKVSVGGFLFAAGKKTLVLTGRLMQSITYNVVANGVEWGTNVIYAAVHQFGASFTVHGRSQQIYRRTNKAQTAIEPGFVSKKKANFASWVTLPAHQVNIPARPFVGFDQEDEAETANTLRNFMARILTGSARDFLGAV